MDKKYILMRAKRLMGIHFLLSLPLLFLAVWVNPTTSAAYIIFVIAVSEHIMMFAAAHKWVIQPIKSLNKLYKAFAGGYLVYDVFHQTNELSKEHSNMMKQMNNLLEQKALVELNKSQAEYMALQNQINPHFLYNTLEGIRSEALIGGLPLVGEMTEVLAKFFRYTISNLGMTVTVEDELLNVKHYCKIQHFRLGEKVAYQMIFEEGQEAIIKKMRMPKLILQPIVENAIRHGIEPLICNGMITIRFHLFSKRLVIIISDNGIGMEKSRLDKLNERMKKIQLETEDARQEKGGIALGNVDSRIKLLFGPDYGLHFYSKEGYGLDVEITLPVVKEKRAASGDVYE